MKNTHLKFNMLIVSILFSSTAKVHASTGYSSPCSSGDGISVAISNKKLNTDGNASFLVEIILGEEEPTTNQFKVTLPSTEYLSSRFSAVGKSDSSTEAFDAISDAVLIAGKHLTKGTSALQIAYRGTIYNVVCPL